MKAEKAEVIVIGGGIMGCSLALRLAQKGLKVIVLEKGRAGEEASGRCGGGVRQQNRDRAEVPLALAAVKMWAQMEAELGEDVGYRVGGNLRLVNSPAEYETFHRIPDWEREMGLEAEFVSADETRRLAPSLSGEAELLGATYCPTDGTANPLLTIKAIARAARRQGVDIREHEPLIGLEVQSSRVSAALTGQKRYEAEIFVNCAGPWARNICHWVGLDFPVTIKRAQILVTEALPPFIKQFISFDVGYLRQTIEGNVHLGVRSQAVENFDKRVSYQAFQDVGVRFTELFPELSNVNIIRAFAGITHWTPDSIPILDRAPNLDNFYLAAGFSGHGFCLGPIIGRLMAEWIADGQPSLDLTAFAWTR
ncbi:MAG: FAD-binding oxidoreductase, partial [Deltaproteobacteria bacterium]|nr:FAD-binding oxidoreductase [Deltaproteobacteria bacterium]